MKIVVAISITLHAVYSLEGFGMTKMFTFDAIFMREHAH